MAGLLISRPTRAPASSFQASAPVLLIVVTGDDALSHKTSTLPSHSRPASHSPSRQTRDTYTHSWQDSASSTVPRLTSIPSLLSSTTSSTTPGLGLGLGLGVETGLGSSLTLQDEKERLRLGGIELGPRSHSPSSMASSINIPSHEESLCASDGGAGGGRAQLPLDDGEEDLRMRM